MVGVRPVLPRSHQVSNVLEIPEDRGILESHVLISERTYIHSFLKT